MQTVLTEKEMASRNIHWFSHSKEHGVDRSVVAVLVCGKHILTRETVESDKYIILYTEPVVEHNLAGDYQNTRSYHKMELSHIQQLECY